MKKLLLFVSVFMLTSMVSAQWVQITNGLGDAPPTSMFPFVDTVYLGTYGDGLFRTLDNGENWADINGNLANQNVNGIFYGPLSTSIFVATAGGPFATQDLSSYVDCTATGLTNTDLNYFWFGGDDNTEWAIGTNGGGIFGSSESTGPWTTYNNGISGDGLYVNDMGGYADQTIDYSVAGTNNGVYFSTDNFATWVESNNGLSGDALIVNDLTGLSSLIIIATDAGLHMTYDNGANWSILIPDEIFTTVFFIESELSGTGFFCYAFGENGYYSEDFKTYTPIDMGGIPGMVTCATANSTDLFIGITIEEKDNNRSGGMYCQPISEIVGISEQRIISKHATLKQNFPNPFTESTEIKYTLKTPGIVSIKIYSSLGHEVHTFVNDYKTSGNHSLRIELPGISEKILYYSLFVNDQLTGTRKMVIL